MAGEDVLKAGDWVEVRPLAEILATLDAAGSREALPFMPEMAQFEGQRFRIFKSAHKTCDPTGESDLRRVADAAHLPTRCDGSAHDGCESRCLLFWKQAWLKPVDGPGGPRPTSAAAPIADLSALVAATRYKNEAGETRYRCQATEIARASSPLSVSDPRPYMQDVTTGNVSFGRFLSIMGRAYGRAFAGKLLKLAGRKRASDDFPAPTEGAPTEARKKLGLRPGELVTVRSAGEIVATLDKNRKSRGLAVELEMLRHCGKTYRVLSRVNRIVDERSGRMIKVGEDCVALEGVVCQGLDNRRRIFCPRGPLYFWREAWLTRANEAVGSQAA